MPSPVVSVITIFLNPGKFLETALDSVFAQTFSDWELLLVDDGSSDGSSETARALSVREPKRVRFLEHPGHENRGMSASRNLGLEHARGELIAYIDADDFWMPKKLADQVSLFESCPEIHMLYGPAILWHSWRGAPGEPDTEQKLGVEPDRVYQPLSLLPTFLSCTECTPAPSVTMLRRETLVGLGGNENAFRTMYEDQVVFSKVASAFPVYVSSGVSCKVRLHENSCCAIALAEQTHLADRREFLLWLQGFLSQRGLEDTDVSAAWQTEWERFFGWKAQLKDHLRPFVPRCVRSWFKLAGYT